ncbi:MAG: SCO family protein [Betaproteobacteria bacterium]|nr:SCO family protein [Betaproteobacteria bacterium]
MAATAWCSTSVLGSDAGSRAAEAETSVSPGLDAAASMRLSQSAIGRKVSDFTLLDREGRSVRLSSYRGKPLLVSFIFTGCFQVCPLTTRSLQKAVESGRDVFGTNQYNVISIGFNQPADSPMALKAFARQHRIDQPNWEFLSPHASIVESLAQEFGFSYKATPAGFDHVLQVTMLDAEGRIYRQIYGEELDADSLGEPLKQLMRNAPVAQQLKLDDLIDRVRILCTVYDPKTGAYRVKYDLLIEVAGGVTFALAMIWFFLAEWWSRRKARQIQAGHATGRSEAAA